MTRSKIRFLIFDLWSSFFGPTGRFRTDCGQDARQQRSKTKARRSKSEPFTCHWSPFLRVRYTRLSISSAHGQVHAANQFGIHDCLFAARNLYSAAVATGSGHRINPGPLWLLFFRPVATHRPPQSRVGVSRTGRRPPQIFTPSFLSES